MTDEISNVFSHMKSNKDNIENDMVEGDSNEDIENDMVEGRGFIVCLMKYDESSVYEYVYVK